MTTWGNIAADMVEAAGWPQDVVDRVKVLSAEGENPPSGTTPELWGQQVLYSLAETDEAGHMFGKFLAEDDRCPLEELLPDWYPSNAGYTTSNFCSFPGWPWEWREALGKLLRDVERGAIMDGATEYRSRTGKGEGSK